MKNNFILVDKVSEEVCDKLVNFFHTHKHTLGVRGRTDKGYSENKQSLDIYIHPDNNNEPFVQYNSELQLCLNKYNKIYPETEGMERYQLCEHYNIQYYEPGEGFKNWHSERTTFTSSKRVLVFMTYLTDTKNAGTEFKYQKLKTDCKKGSTVIWPAEWTHTHKGIISNKHAKMIITGWWSFLAP